jgi:hypothetical protein
MASAAGIYLAKAALPIEVLVQSAALVPSLNIFNSSSVSFYQSLALFCRSTTISLYLVAAWS